MQVYFLPKLNSCSWHELGGVVSLKFLQYQSISLAAYIAGRLDNGDDQVDRGAYNKSYSYGIQISLAC